MTIPGSQAPAMASRAMAAGHETRGNQDAFKCHQRFHGGSLSPGIGLTVSLMLPARHGASFPSWGGHSADFGGRLSQATVTRRGIRLGNSHGCRRPLSPPTVRAHRGERAMALAYIVNAGIIHPLSSSGVSKPHTYLSGAHSQWPLRVVSSTGHWPRMAPLCPLRTGRGPPSARRVRVGWWSREDTEEILPPHSHDDISGVG